MTAMQSDTNSKVPASTMIEPDSAPKQDFPMVEKVEFFCSFK
jgi:hypothetical protein